MRISDHGMHHGTCVTHVPWCMSGLLTHGGGENVPGIPGACATRNFTYPARGPLWSIECVSEYWRIGVNIRVTDINIRYSRLLYTNWSINRCTAKTTWIYNFFINFLEVLVWVTKVLDAEDCLFINTVITGNGIIWQSVQGSTWIFNSLTPAIFQFNFRKVIFKLTLVNGGWGISYEVALRWMPLDLTDKSTLVQVMAWCRQATSHYLSQCRSRSMSPNGVNRPQWIESPNWTVWNTCFYIAGNI